MQESSYPPKITPHTKKRIIFVFFLKKNKNPFECIEKTGCLKERKANEQNSVQNNLKKQTKTLSTSQLQNYQMCDDLMIQPMLLKLRTNPQKCKSLLTVAPGLSLGHLTSPWDTWPLPGTPNLSLGHLASP